MVIIKNILNGFNKYKNLLYELVIRDIKIRYRRSFLGLLWTLINPVLTMIVMTIVFQHFLRFDISNYPVYFFAGNILFSFFTEATSNAMHAITDNGSLLKKVYIPKYLFPVSKVLSSGVNLFFSFIAMLLVMLFTGVEFQWTLLLTPLVMLYILMFAIGIGMVLSTVMVFFRDIAHLYGIFTMLWMYLTPIFYPESFIDRGYAYILLYINPMIYFVRYMRNIVLDGVVPGLQLNLLCFTYGFAFLLLGMAVFYKKQDKFILYI